jgi:AraC-like DNA-binding protein
MELNFWSILLIAFLSQTMFLIFCLLAKPSANKQANTILIALLFVAFCIQVSNFAEATYLYRKIFGITEWERGMGLLLGPLLYFYGLSILKPDFAFKKSHLLHVLPYLTAVVIVFLQDRAVIDKIVVLAIDSVMAGTMKMTGLSSLWFFAYFLHMTVYLILIRLSMRNPNEAAKYRVPLTDRIQWLNNISFLFGLVVLMYFGIIIYVVITGYYTAKGNFVYSMLLGGMIYTIAFKTLSASEKIKPDFEKKYKSIHITQVSEEEILKKIVRYFENEKLFLNPDFRMNTLAMTLKITPQVLSSIINRNYEISFSELVNNYRIEEIKKRLVDPEYKHFSIFGIALDVGFTSKSAFNIAFKKSLGTTPSNFLKSLN